MNYIYQNSQTEAGEYDRSALEQLLGELEEGDCLAVAQLSCAADSAAALLELLEDMHVLSSMSPSAPEIIRTTSSPSAPF